MDRGDVVILLDGGHKTFVTNTTVSELEHDLSAARASEQNFIYIQKVIHGGDNACVIDPNKVVGVVARVR